MANSLPTMNRHNIQQWLDAFKQACEKQNVMKPHWVRAALAVLPPLYVDFFEQRQGEVKSWDEFKTCMCDLDHFLSNLLNFKKLENERDIDIVHRFENHWRALVAYLPHRSSFLAMGKTEFLPVLASAFTNPNLCLLTQSCASDPRMTMAHCIMGIIRQAVAYEENH
ncbi:hypothetical protein DM01DRAFT_309454 [Hesseltinella vesiculosa]|uniref:Uncharacterized protein n=1 Tax=Hesseltinella vesiculosa TaxID=101127 RepID=A0A1X2GFS8_9FUNG|nr:hypothetical protein DM01DRAFT_309454 [Hesseltinella vesiculosa]